MKGDAYLFDVRPGTAWINDIQKQVQVGGAKYYRGRNPAAGTAIELLAREAGVERQDQHQ